MIEEIEDKLQELKSGEITYAELGEWFAFNGSYIKQLLLLSEKALEKQKGE